MPGQVIQTGVHVEGLAALMRAMVRVAPEARKQLRTAAKNVGGKLASQTAAKVPKRTGNAARSLKPSVKGNDVLVTGGGGRAPYYPWLDFGGTVGRGRKSTTTITLFTDRTGKVRMRSRTDRARKTGTSTRPFIKGGRYLYPTLERLQHELRADLRRAVADACRAAGVGPVTG